MVERTEGRVASPCLVGFAGVGGGMTISSSPADVPHAVAVALVVQKTVVAVLEIAAVVLGILNSHSERAPTCTLTGMFGVAGLRAGPPPLLRTLLRVHTLIEVKIASTSDVLLMLLLGVVYRHAKSLLEKI